MRRPVTFLMFLLGLMAGAQVVSASVDPAGEHHAVLHEAGDHGAPFHGGVCPGEQNGVYHSCGGGFLAIDADSAPFVFGRATRAGIPRATVWRAHFVERVPPVPRILA